MARDCEVSMVEELLKPAPVASSSRWRPTEWHSKHQCKLFQSIPCTAAPSA